MTLRKIPSTKITSEFVAMSWNQHGQQVVKEEVWLEV